MTADTGTHSAYYFHCNFPPPCSRTQLPALYRVIRSQARLARCSISDFSLGLNTSTMLPSLKLPGVPRRRFVLALLGDQSATKGVEVAFHSAGVRLGSLRVYICLSLVQYYPKSPYTDGDADAASAIF
jgi:hypothetical protein